jgi:D-isomer specific 2-hydroxyacid dehydrogenase, NAD binding domain
LPRSLGDVLVRRAQVFDMQIRAIPRRAQSKVADGVCFIGGPERLDDVLRCADYLAITLSLSPETRGLLDTHRLGVMKRSAFLINVARAEIIDELALYQALASARIAGAAPESKIRLGLYVAASSPCDTPALLQSVIFKNRPARRTGRSAKLPADSLARFGGRSLQIPLIISTRSWLRPGGPWWEVQQVSRVRIGCAPRRKGVLKQPDIDPPGHHRP